MEIEIKDGAVCIDVEQLFGALTPEAKKRAAEIIGADIEAWREMARARAEHLHDLTNRVATAIEALPALLTALLNAEARLQALPPDARHPTIHGEDGVVAGLRAARKLAALPTWAPADEARLRERDAAPEMRKTLETAALVIHAPHALTFESCPDSVCSSTRAALTLAREGK